MNDPTLRDLSDAVVRFRDERDWAQFHTLRHLTAGLGIECAELAEIFLWKTDDQARALLDEPAARERIANELADVQVYLLYLAHATGISLSEAVHAKLKLNASKYPVEKSRGSAKKYDEL